MEYKGFFINLERSADRRAEMEGHLAQCGLGESYARFPAAEGNSLNLPNPHPRLLPGEIGCFISHYLLLKENLGSTVPLHVVEDDVIFSRYATAVIQSLIVSGNLDTYDIVYLDTFVLTSSPLYKQYLQLYRENVRRDAEGVVQSANFKLLDMQDVAFATTASMLISPKAIGKLHDLYAAELAGGPQMQVDLFIRHKAHEGAIKVGCIFPFATSVRLEHALDTTMNEHKLRLSALATVIARHAFFVEADWKRCLEYTERYMSPPAEDLQMKVLAQILGFTLDDRFKFA